MYKNEFLEKCLHEDRNENISIYVVRAYTDSKDHKYNELVIDDLGFTCSYTDRLELFKDTLIKAQVKEFVLSDSSSSLMDDLHTFDKVGIKIKELADVKYTDKWDGSEQIKQGIRMIIK